MADRRPFARAGIRLSVVLPVLDEARDLGPLLDRLRSQDLAGDRFEVLVVDGGSTDGTRELVRERAAAWQALRLLPNPGRRSSPARNVGARAAAGEFVLYLDGHCQIDGDGLLRRVLEIFEESGADCLCRPQPLTHGSESPWAEAISAARHSPLGHNPGSDIYRDTPGFTRPESAGAAYRREVILSLGGFDERFDACEDVEFNHRVARAGYRAYVHPDLAVRYRPRDTLGGLFRQMFRYGRGRARLMARHPRMVSPVLLGLTAITAFLAALLLAGGARGAATVLVAGALYAACCLVAAAKVGSASHRIPRTALVFPVIHAGLLLGFWRGLPEALYFRSPASTALKAPGKGGQHVSA